MNTPEFDVSTEQLLKMLKVYAYNAMNRRLLNTHFYRIRITTKYDGVILSKCLNVQIKI